MTHEFAVELRDVVKNFTTPEGNEISAVDHVTLQIRNGEFFSLLGSSGCGKTTSLRMIAGFEWPSSGEVYIEGQPMGHRPPFQRKVNTVFQNYALFQHMTVYQNVAFGLEMEGAKKDEIEKRVSSPAVSSSGSRWPAHWSRHRTCCSWTSPSAPWI
jgi:spermidine/putrescine transport system ATP-binding protein